MHKAGEAKAGKWFCERTQRNPGFWTQAFSRDQYELLETQLLWNSQRRTSLFRASGKRCESSRWKECTQRPFSLSPRSSFYLGLGAEVRDPKSAFAAFP